MNASQGLVDHLPPLLRELVLRAAVLPQDEFATVAAALERAATGEPVALQRARRLLLEMLARQDRAPGAFGADLPARQS